MKRMIFTQGNSTSPHNGEIRDIDGILWNLRVVMNEQDAEVMRAMAAAPDLIQALIDLRSEIRASKPFNVKRDYSLMVADASATKLLISLGVIK